MMDANDIRNENATFIKNVMLIWIALFICSSCTKNTANPTCRGGINQPVRRVVFAWKTDTFGRDPSPDGDINYAGKLLLDTELPTKRTTDESAIKAQEMALVADNYFVNLGRENYGSWDGCYGSNSTERIMTTRLHAPIQPDGSIPCGFQGKSWAEVLLNDSCVTPTAIAHEWTHGLVERTLGLKPDDVPSAKQSAAAYEALGDIFAVIIAGDEDSYTVNLATGPIRNLANPVSIEYSNSKDKYENSRIFSYAAYLLMDVRRAQSNPSATGLEKYPVQPIGKDKVGRIFFHALSPGFVKHLTSDKHEFSGEYTFEELAIGIFTACVDLSNSDKGGIESSDCEQTKMAFCAAGILKEPTCPTPLFTPTPTRWYIRVYNIDDQGIAYVNDSKITEIDFLQDSGWIDVTSYLSAPTNKVRFTLRNGPQGYTWGFAIKRDNTIVWEDIQGEVNVRGANNNDYSQTDRIVYDRTILIDPSGEIHIEP